MVRYLLGWCVNTVYNTGRRKYRRIFTLCLFTTLGRDLVFVLYYRVFSHSSQKQLFRFCVFNRKEFLYVLLGYFFSISYIWNWLFVMGRALGWFLIQELWIIYIYNSDVKGCFFIKYYGFCFWLEDFSLCFVKSVIPCFFLFLFLNTNLWTDINTVIFSTIISDKCICAPEVWFLCGNIQL